MVSAPVSGRTETLGAGEAGHTLESATSATSWIVDDGYLPNLNPDEALSWN
jgi:hypothetical protein